MRNKMRVLASTTATQGERKNDFCFVPEGELVTLPFECDGERVDGRCGCRRSFAGMQSHRATTTAKVIEFRGTHDDYIGLVRTSMQSAGLISSATDEKLVLDFADQLLSLGAEWPLGTVLEKRGNEIQLRRHAIEL